MRRLGFASVALLALAVPAASAQNATVRDETPRGRTVVLEVRDSGGQRCLTTTFADEGPRRTSPCVAPPKDAHDDAAGLHVVYRARPEKVAIIHGTVSDQTAVLKVRFGDGRLETIRPQRGTGAYLRVIAGRPRVATVNAHDRSGRLRGAADLDPRATKVVVRGPFRLFGTRDERGGRATVTAFAARVYRERSTRRSLHACMAITPRRDVPSSNVEPGYAGGVACTNSTRRVLVRYAAGCAEKRLLLYGIVPRAVTRLQLITAKGERIGARVGAFPRALRHRGRAFVISRPDPGRLVRMEAFARNGQRLASLPLSGVGSGCSSSRS